MDQNKTMKERLLDQSNKSDIPTITYVTTRAIIFYVCAVAVVIGMFGNWFALNLNLGYLQLNEVLGTVNPFTMVGALGEVKESLGMFGMFLPADVMNGLGALQFVSYVLMILAIGAVVLYAYAAFLRIKENDQTARFGKIGAVCAIATVVVFIGMVVGLLVALDASSYIGGAIGKIMTGPCMITLICAAVSAWAAVMDMGFKEDVIIYHDGTLKIDRGTKWKCSCCHRKNLSMLEKCYYCGKEK